MQTVQVVPGQTIAPNVFLDDKSKAVVSSQLVIAPDADRARNTTDDRYLVTSPYTQKAHVLDLTTLGPEQALLARALVHMRSVRPDYATAPYIDTFNWSQVIAALRALASATGQTWRKTSFYVVVFRSRIPPTTVYADLGRLDKAAHAEAMASGGFLKYWFGTPDADGRNLATCIWRSAQDAYLGGLGPAHRAAAGAARSLYTLWKIDRLRLTIDDHVNSWQITDWVD